MKAQAGSSMLNALHTAFFFATARIKLLNRLMQYFYYGARKMIDKTLLKSVF